MTIALGKISFSDTPDVNGALLLTAQTLPAQLTNLVVPGTEGMVIPTGTTLQRPAVPTPGEIRFNTDNDLPEIYAQGAWLPYARVLQTVSGPIPVKNTSGVFGKIVATTAPTKNNTAADGGGIEIWSTSFTPLVAGSNIVIQYTVTAFHTATATRALFTSAFVGTTCVGLVMSGLIAQATTSAPAGGLANLAMQAVYTSTSTTPITISAQVGHFAAANTAVVIGLNQTAITNGNFGAAMVTEYRILEII